MIRQHLDLRFQEMFWDKIGHSLGEKTGHLNFILNYCREVFHHPCLYRMYTVTRNFALQIFLVLQFMRLLTRFNISKRDDMIRHFRLLCSPWALFLWSQIHSVPALHWEWYEQRGLQCPIKVSLEGKQ